MTGKPNLKHYSFVARVARTHNIKSPLHNLPEKNEADFCKKTTLLKPF